MRSAIISAAFVAGALAIPFGHKHQHQERAVVTEYDVVYVTEYFTYTYGASTPEPASSSTSHKTSSTSSSKKTSTTSSTKTSSSSVKSTPKSTPKTSSTSSTKSSSKAATATSTSKASSAPASTSSKSSTKATSSTKASTSSTKATTSSKTSSKAATAPASSSAAPVATSSSSSSSTVKATPISSSSSAPPASTVVPSSSHSSASTISAASSVPTTYEEIVVYHHNIHRANHSADAITWSDSLASSAAEVAASCVYAHNVTAAGGGYGQNIAAGVESNNVSAIITDLFYNGEVNYFNGLYGEAQPDMTNFEHWGHFSQIVWKGTSQVGCATQDCTSGGLANVGSDVAPYFTVCNYEAPGNYANEYGANIGSPLGEPTANWNTGL